MEDRRGDGSDERARLARLLAWRRAQKTGPETHARGWLSYVGSVAWLGLGVLTVALVAQRSGRGSVVATLPPAAAEIIRPLARVEPATSIAARAAKALSMRVRESEAAYARPERPAGVASTRRPALSAAVSVRRPEVRAAANTAPPVEAALPASVTPARRWIGCVPEAREAIVRWVKSQPPLDGRLSRESERPQAP